MSRLDDPNLRESSRFQVEDCHRCHSAKFPLLRNATVQIGADVEIAVRLEMKSFFFFFLRINMCSHSKSVFLHNVLTVGNRML